MIRNLLGAAVLAAGLFALPAQAKNVELGLLDCAVEGGVGLVLASNKTLTCTFRPADRSYGSEVYTGVISKLGVDVGITNGTSITWAVLAAQWEDYGPGSLAGNYIGASAEASVVTGGGANLLVGGSGRSFSLQPLSVQAQTGLNVAAGIAHLELYSSLK